MLFEDNVIIIGESREAIGNLKRQTSSLEMKGVGALSTFLCVSFSRDSMEVCDNRHIM